MYPGYGAPGYGAPVYTTGIGAPVYTTGYGAPTVVTETITESPYGVETVIDTVEYGGYGAPIRPATIVGTSVGVPMYGTTVTETVETVTYPGVRPPLGGGFGYY